jgi:hypothetical protein
MASVEEEDSSPYLTHRTYPIMQWNQKDLTLLAATADGYNDSVERSTKVARTIKEFNGNNGPGVCIFEEVRTGGGGKRALEFIVDYLNKNSYDDSWRYKLSGEVNPQGRRRELYAVIWRQELMGDLHADPAENGHRIMTDGFYPKYGRRTAASETVGLSTAPASVGAEEKDPLSNDPPKFAGTTIQFAGCTIELATAQQSWATLDSDGEVNLYFDRAPVLFSFSPPTSKFDIHIVACHAATGGEFKTPYQNMIEAAFVQSICTQAVEQGKYVVLLGDFNTDEEYNKTARMWDSNVPFTVQIENDLFAATKQAFLEQFYRGVPSGLPTNLFPFLAGGGATPKHNDDIWLPDVDEKVRHITFNGKLDSGVHKGVIHKIPQYVLIAWDVKTRAYFDTLGNTNFKSASKHTLNRLLSMTWSDHRPITVIISPTMEYVNFGDEVHWDSGIEESSDEEIAEEMVAILELKDKIEHGPYNEEELARLKSELDDAVALWERKQEEDKEKTALSDAGAVTRPKVRNETVKKEASVSQTKKQTALTEFFP